MRIEVEGRCHCGEINYTAKINPENVIICHCTDCQTVSSAPYRVSVPVLPENFQLSGEPKIYVKIGGSGAKIATRFCGTCGTALFSSKLENPTRFNLRLGAIKQRAELAPKMQGFCRSAMPWAWDIRDVRKLD
jgi:hypothetical protein